ncbi:predicted protein [Sclerotinia sclerotiorum 1980 UF-70]|uniref:Uncharacterized protein n=1 Tax=Sclerotinia sclerotiorum (strain ATCC 18683 / 1980 / Ss-1) TaxID=665079 RepID=A7F9C6_SCLS1|nr:predicted protein [Sclerotinia sclerotiorum 1980 UF-70]EDO00337.1 predicted protein [Sclerotinia sclerotiorum 1980 UF-70]
MVRENLEDEDEDQDQRQREDGDKELIFELRNGSPALRRIVQSRKQEKNIHPPAAASEKVAILMKQKFLKVGEVGEVGRQTVHMITRYGVSLTRQGITESLVNKNGDQGKEKARKSLRRDEDEIRRPVETLQGEHFKRR